MSLLPVGTPAPDFALASSPRESLSLRDLRGQNVVLAFYPADWSPVCTDQLGVYAEAMPIFRELDARVLGLSVDSRWCHEAWKRARNLNFPLLADFEPKGAVARAYGVYRAEDGTSERALYVIDREGIIRWAFLSPIGVNPGAEGILDALESLRAQGAPA